MADELEQKAKKLKAEYQRKWRKANKDKVSKHNKRYWKNKAKQALKEEKAE